MARVCSIAVMCALVVTAYGQQMLRMCTCDEVRPCQDNTINSVQPCSDKCQRYAEQAGAKYAILRDCILEYRPQIVKTIECVKQQLTNTCSQGPSNQQVAKRYPIGLELAFVEEINSMVSVAGLSDQVTQFVGIGCKFGGCIQECVGKMTGRCAVSNNCGLNLPPDQELVQIVKNCAIQNQLFTTPILQAFCGCAVRSGVASLTQICPVSSCSKRVDVAA